MGQRSKVYDLAPEDKAELDRRLVESGFKNYKGLETWLRALGYEISKSALQRYGDPFEEKCAALKIATEQARAVVDASPDDEGAMNEALIRLVQKELFEILIAFKADPAKTNIGKITVAIADLARASLSQKKYAKQAREDALKEAAERVLKTGERLGLKKTTMEEITAALAGGG